MPITQQRMISMIQAARAAQQAILDIKSELKAAIELFEQGIMSKDEFVTRLNSTFYATALQEHHVVNIAREEQHFHDFARRNDYEANRRAGKRAGNVPRQRTTPLRIRKNRPGMIREEFSPNADQLAMAQKAPEIGNLEDLTSDIGPPTPEQLAADDAMMAELDESEMANHIAKLREGDQ